MTKATTDAAGTSGLVPAPAAGRQTYFLRGDATWAVPTNTTYTAGTGLSLSSNKFSLASSGVTAGTYGSSTKVPVIKVDTYGRVTSASTSTISYTTITDCLYTNSSPTSSFAAQTITTSATKNYKMYIFIYRFSTTTKDLVTQVISSQNYSATGIPHWFSYSCLSNDNKIGGIGRSVEIVNTTSFKFYSAYSYSTTGQTTNNGDAIPYKIYGVE